MTACERFADQSPRDRLFVDVADAQIDVVPVAEIDRERRHHPVDGRRRDGRRSIRRKRVFVERHWSLPTPVSKGLSVSVPQGLSIIARQFTAGKRVGVHDGASPGGTTEVGRGSHLNRPYGTSAGSLALPPGDESPGYSPATLRVESCPCGGMLHDSRRHSPRIVLKVEITCPGYARLDRRV